MRGLGSAVVASLRLATDGHETTAISSSLTRSTQGLEIRRLGGSINRFRRLFGQAEQAISFLIFPGKKGSGCLFFVAIAPGDQFLQIHRDLPFV